MRTIIRDTAVLTALRPQDIAVYLRTHNWKQEQLLGDKGAIWTNAAGFEVLLPLRKDLADYDARIADVLTVLERAEERSQLSLLGDLTDTGADIIRLNLSSPLLANGTLPLLQATRVVVAAKDMMLAAACAAIDPRPVYATRKPDQAMEYLQGVRMGQTELGSYVLTIRSNVPPRMDGDIKNELALHANPFERQVTLTLAHALHICYQAVIESGAGGGNFGPFEQAVKQGVSANLLAALADMGEAETPLDVRIDLHWATVRAVPPGTPHQIRFPSDAIPLFKEAARVIKEYTPQDSFMLEGTVTMLKRERGNKKGEVTITGFVDGRLISVKMILPADDYRQAIKAHDKRLPISCEGELVRSGNFYRLENPRRFVIRELEADSRANG